MRTRFGFILSRISGNNSEEIRKWVPLAYFSCLNKKGGYEEVQKLVLSVCPFASAPFIEGKEEGSIVNCRQPVDSLFF